MIRILNGVILCGALGLLAGCSGAQKELNTTGSQGNQDWQQRKEAFRKEMADQLAELDKQARVWKEKTDQATGEAKRKMQLELEQLNEKSKDLHARRDSLQGENWEKAKQGFHNAMSDLKAAFEKARDRFK